MFLSSINRIDTFKYLNENMNQDIGVTELIILHAG